jgi:hypothetical protein
MDREGGKKMPDRVIGYLCPTIRYYGCVKCQAYHFEGEPLFQEHILDQSKHGIQQMPVTEYEKYHKKEEPR